MSIKLFGSTVFSHPRGGQSCTGYVKLLAYFILEIMIQWMPAYLRMLKRTKPGQTAVKSCQKAEQQLQACLRPAY